MDQMRKILRHYLTRQQQNYDNDHSLKIMVGKLDDRQTIINKTRPKMIIELI